MSKIDKQKIGIIGFGNMGQAIAEQLKPAYQVSVFDKGKFRLKDAGGVNIESDCSGLISKVTTVILAAKPQDFQALLLEVKPSVKDELIISIAAGITTAFIEKSLGSVRVIRVMPNMPARIGCGMTCLCKGKFSSIEDLDCADELFSYMGETLRIDEKMMNAVTAVSGSGPAYVCYFLEQDSEEFLRNFQAAAEAVGFNAQEASLLTKTTYFGTKEYLKNSKLSCGELIKQVASKGGTTEAALKVLDKGGSLTEAVKAALKRAGQLSR